MEYVITRRDGARAGRARPVELLAQESPWFGGAPSTYHVDAYLRLLARQVETLLAPFGYEEEQILSWLRGTRRAPSGHLNGSGPR